MEDQRDIENDRQRAEVFDALGHPTRIAILKILSEDSFGFAELKKKTNIDSSGHLQHHLNKLDGLIKTDDLGKYCLSDQGKDALLTVQTVEKVSVKESKNSEKSYLHFSNKKVAIKSLTILLTVLLIVSVFFAFYEHSRNVGFQREIERSKEFNAEATAYYNEFGVIPDINVGSSFSPPVSVYRALQMGLRADGWNKTSLYGFRVGAYLKTWRQITDPNLYKITIPVEVNLEPLTVPPSDYSPVYGEGVIYRYVWQIVVTDPIGIQIPPPGFVMIDAATGQIVPNPSLY